MKNIMRLGLILGFSIITLFLYSQQECKVLKREISGTYEGKCKKGLANGKGVATGIDKYEGRFMDGLPHGEGTYTWANGTTYTGEWVEGKRHGNGKFTMQTDGKDSVQAGVWQQDEYFGPKPQAPTVIYKNGVDRFNFQKNLTVKNRVLIDIFQNGMRNTGISNLLISASSGYESSVGESFGYDAVTFPVTIKLSYTTMNKLKTMPVGVRFDFIIFEPGDWTVELNN